MHCTHVSDIVSLTQVEDLKYLGFVTIEVSQTAYLLFKESGLLPSREQLWEMRKLEILALPDPLANLSAEQRRGFDSIRDEIEKVFKKYIQPGQIEFRAMPAGNEHVLRGFTSHFVIDSNIVCSIEEVHKRMEALYGSDSECQQSCQCLRQLLILSMADALSRQTHGHSKDRIYREVMAQYIRCCECDISLPSVVSPPVSSAANLIGSRPSSASNSREPNAGPPGVTANSAGSQHMPQAEQSHGDSLSLDGLNIDAEDSIAQPDSPSCSQPQPVVRVVRERETPFVPNQHDPVVFHNNIQAALASVLQHSAGQTSEQGVVRSSRQPSGHGVADTITVRLCPNTSKHTLEASKVLSHSCTVERRNRWLYVPKGFDMGGWPQSKSASVQQLYCLLERIHELIQPGLAPVHLYYDADDACIAFNKGNQLWYNAFADEVYSQPAQSVRHFDWYVTVCHELAHHFRREHDEVFSDYLAHIVLPYSRGFYHLCCRLQLDI